MIKYLKEIEKEGYIIKDHRKSGRGFEIIKQPHLYLKLSVVGLRFGITTTVTKLFGRESVDGFDTAFQQIRTISINLNYLIEQENIKEEANESSK